MPASLAPSWDLATERAYRASVVEACRGTTETWVVAPFSLAASYPALVCAPGTAYPLMPLDWAQLAETLEQRLVLPRRQSASGLAWTAALVRALREMADQRELPVTLRDAVTRDAVGVARALSRSVQTLCEQGPALVAVPEGGAFVRSNLELLLGLKARVTADLAAQGLATGPMRWGAIAEALRVGPCFGLPPRLVLDGVDTLDFARADAVAALAACGVEIQAPPWLPLPGLVAVAIGVGAAQPPTPAAIVRRHRDVHEEVLGALAWVREHLEAGAAIADLAIMVPPGAGYEALLHETFAAAGVPVSAPYQPTVTGLREIQALRAYASVRTGQLDVVDLVTLLAAAEAVNGPELLACRSTSSRPCRPRPPRCGRSWPGSGSAGSRSPRTRSNRPATRCWRPTSPCTALTSPWRPGRLAWSRCWRCRSSRSARRRGRSPSSTPAPMPPPC